MDSWRHPSSLSQPTFFCCSFFVDEEDFERFLIGKHKLTQIIFCAFRSWFYLSIIELIHMPHLTLSIFISDEIFVFLCLRWIIATNLLPEILPNVCNISRCIYFVYSTNTLCTLCNFYFDRFFQLSLLCLHFFKQFNYSSHLLRFVY